MNEQTDDARLTAKVQGRVQGVSFRAWVHSQADDLGLVGSAANEPDGGVLVVAEGPREQCAALLAALRGGETPGQVDTVDEDWEAPRGDMDGFVER